MEKENISKFEAFLRDLFKDLGNAAIAVMSMGRFKPTKEETPKENDDSDDNEPVISRKLRPSDFKQDYGEFFIPPGHRQD
ncbi:MAG: hypothetical protein OEX81_02650 [Candidatus Pacebacteria bacterium]|nr:hypothetical protein [Candidatus Paceibacterota bacterium]